MFIGVYDEANKLALGKHRELRHNWATIGHGKLAGTLQEPCLLVNQAKFGRVRPTLNMNRRGHPLAAIPTHRAQSSRLTATRHQPAAQRAPSNALFGPESQGQNPLC